MQFETKHFIKEAVQVEDADEVMIIGAHHVPKVETVNRIVLLSVARDEASALANLVAQELDMTVHFLDDGSAEAVTAACALEHCILIPSPQVARQDGVLAALARDAKVFFSMINPVRIAVSLGLSGDEGEAFCRDAIAFEDFSLAMSHMILPDGTSPEDLKTNILNSLGRF